MREPSGAPIVNRNKLLVWTRQARRGSSTFGIVWITGYDRLSKIDLTASDFIDVLDVIEVQPMCRVIFEGDHGFTSQLALQCRSPELCLCCLNILVHLAWAYGWQWNAGTPAASQWAKITD